MKYSELNVTFDDKDTWEYEKQHSRPFRFSELWHHNEEFKLHKAELKKQLEGQLLDVIDECEQQEDIGKVLDPVFERYHKSYFMAEHVNEELLLKKANRNTLGKKLQDWCKQCNLNAPIVKKTPGASVFYGKLRNVPAVVVAAGPSLGTNIELLKELKGKAVVMALDTSFRSCFKRGITPTFVNAHDANEAGHRFFLNQPCPETYGLFVNYVHPKIIESYQGPKAFYYVDDSSLPVYGTMALACDEEGRPDGSFRKSKVTGGSSVAHTAMYLALLMGCNPVTFVGLDLSYPDLEKSHFESDNMKDVRSQKLIDVEDVQGRMIKTNLSFYSYKVVMERMAETMGLIFNAQLFNSSEDKNGLPAGVVHKGLKPLALRQFINDYCTNDREELKQLQDFYSCKT